MGRALPRREIAMEASAREETMTVVRQGGGPAKPHSGGDRDSSPGGGGGEDTRQTGRRWMDTAGCGFAHMR